MPHQYQFSRLFSVPRLLVGGGAFLYGLYHFVILSAVWQRDVSGFILHPEAHQEEIQAAGVHCNGAPFQFPTSGYIGYLWDISLKPFHRHQGVDIFSGEEPGKAPVYAVADGYLTREKNWKSSLIQRIPMDPLQRNRQIWVYYTHMALADGTTTIAADFPPGSSETFVRAGTLLGYQGNYSGNPDQPVGVHLHISIVKDDGSGHYTNELRIQNTLDPSPYFGLPLNANAFPQRPIGCVKRE